MSPESILSFAEYARIRHTIPYLVDVGGGGGRLVLFGAQHSTDPADSMFEQIESEFLRLAPALALHEGAPPAVESEREWAIRRHGEAGFVRHLAGRAGIETASMDIPLAEEAQLLGERIGAADALVFLVVRQLASFNRKTARPNFNTYFADFFAVIGPPLGLVVEWPLIEREHLRLLGYPLDAHRVTAAETDPMRDALPTQRIARASNRWRDERMLRALIEARRKRGRVFAVAGVSHVVMLEPAIRAALRDT